jgi:sialate O-acetylesterase
MGASGRAASRAFRNKRPSFFHLMITFRVLVLWGVSLLAGSAHAAVRLPRLVGDHMVLQRDQPLPLWGWAAADERVIVTFQGKTYPASLPDVTGKWTVTLPPTPAGGPFDLRVTGHNEIQLHDVLVGDVWLGSGQSNMEWPLRDAKDGATAISSADLPQIRLMNVPNEAAYTPQADMGGAGWQVCTPQTVADFSAVLFFFGRELYEHYHIPIGLIGAEWGGTVAEAWTSGPALQAALPAAFGPRVDFLSRQSGTLAANQHAYDEQLRAWRKSPAGQDHGLLPGQPTWADPATPDADWRTLTLPGVWENQPAAAPELQNFDGIVWLRREVELTRAEAKKDLTLALGRVDDDDSTFFNGVPVGNSHGYNTPRSYTVPARLLKKGRNVIAIRVVDTGGGGGIWGDPAELYLTTATRTLPLTGAWRYRPAFNPADIPKAPFPSGGKNEPTVLFNGMIAPLLPFAIRGVIWYQGESNEGRAAQYRTLFPALIQDWRMRWQQSTLPFLFVQLAGFEADPAEPAESVRAELREAQLLTLKLPHTAMATAIDRGEVNDIHPRDKQTIGHRLALAAQRVAYGDKAVVANGPMLREAHVVGSTIELSFTQATGLTLREPGGPFLKGFAIAGADRHFRWAQGELRGTTLVLHHPDIANPVAVRYDWGNSPFVNLYNGADLPAPPFRTDDWPGLTAGKP